MSDVDGEIAGDLIVNPSEIKGFELSRESVRKSYEDLGPLLTLACLCEGLSEFDLGGLTAPEAAGIMKLAGELSLATGAPLDTGGNRVTIEGNPSGEKDEAAIDAISDYSSRVILALFHRTSSPLDKDRCLLEFGKSLTQIILGDLLF